MTCWDKAGNANQGHVESGLWFILCCLCSTFCFVLNSDFLPNTQEMYTDIPDCYCFWKIERWGMIQLASQRFIAAVCPCQVGVPPSSRTGPGLPQSPAWSCCIWLWTPETRHCRFLSFQSCRAPWTSRWSCLSWARLLGNSCAFHFPSSLFSVRKCLGLLFI